MLHTNEYKNFIALDIDGTIATHDGEIHKNIQHQIRRVNNDGHHIVLATGRSFRDVYPVITNFNIYPEFLVCVNGAVILQKDVTHRKGYSPIHIEHFNPIKPLEAIKQYLPDAAYAVEIHGEGYHYTEHFDIKYVEPLKQQKPYNELIQSQTVRAIVVPENYSNEEIHRIVKNTGVGVVGHAPSVGKSWIEIFAKGVNKAQALERIRTQLDIPFEKVIAVGDGYNDIEMLQWATQGGTGVAMGQAPEDVKKHANKVAPPVTEQGVAWVLEKL